MSHKKQTRKLNQYKRLQQNHGNFKTVRLFQPRLKHTILLNGALGRNPIASGKQ